MKPPCRALLIAILRLVTVQANFHVSRAKLPHNLRQRSVREAVHRDIGGLLRRSQFGDVELFKVFPGREVLSFLHDLRRSMCEIRGNGHARLAHVEEPSHVRSRN